MVRIRLARVGRRHLSHWKIGVFDQRTRRDGKAIEYLGYYDPHKEKPEEKVSVDIERVKYWISKGAQPTSTVSDLLKHAGL